jgi:hypothetical protein
LVVASLMMVMEPGNTTAAALSERSCCPIPQSYGGFFPEQLLSSGVVRVVSLMWKGEPLMIAAEFP